MLRLAPTERASLCDLLLELGPDEPTLCEGWRTRDLAAHLVLREGRLDAMPGIALKFWSGWTDRVQQAIAGGDFRRLVHRLRTGPPLWSPFRPARLDEAANGIEFFVHHEDVRRAQPDWQPRQLGPEIDDLLWQRACRMGKFVLRHEQAGVVLVRTDTGQRHVARQAAAGEPTQQVSGPASELLMYLFDRRSHAKVEVA
jgi:uncharacterized protein (TIGR03085 family)